MRRLLRALPLALLIFIATFGSETVSPEANGPAEPLPQSSSECYSFDSFTDDCSIGTPPDNCRGNVSITGAYVIGAGLKRSEPRTVPCQGCNGSVDNVVTAVDNVNCCDQDLDGYHRAQCLGGTDCNDTPGSGYYINPGRPEICEDGIDNDCQNGDETCPDPCGQLGDFCTIHTGCCDGLMCSGFQCQPLYDPDSPIVVDINGDGFSLTDAAGGVDFDIAATGTPKRLAWTSPGGDDAWLVLDRNANGLIDNGQELFGNHTAQPEPPAGVEKNGFLALAEYDTSANGGNRDGVINPSDAVFTSLRLWQDTNHNGISEPSELHSWPELGLATLELTYKESKRTDQFGNQFRYRAKVRDVHGNRVGRWAWDVFLKMTP